MEPKEIISIDFIREDGSVCITKSTVIEHKGELKEIERQKMLLNPIVPIDVLTAKEILPEHLYNTVATLWGSEPVKQEILEEIDNMAANMQSLQTQTSQVANELNDTVSTLERKRDELAGVVAKETQAIEALSAAQTDLEKAKENTANVEIELQEKLGELSDTMETLDQKKKELEAVEAFAERVKQLSPEVVETLPEELQQEIASLIQDTDT